jgi:hypothetical protein
MADGLRLFLGKRLPDEILEYIAAYGFHLWLARPFEVTTFGSSGPFEHLELHTTRHFVDYLAVPRPRILDVVPLAILEAYRRGVWPACDPMIVEDPRVRIHTDDRYRDGYRTFRWMRYQGEWWACPRAPPNWLLRNEGYMFEDGVIVVDRFADEPSDLDDA